MLYASENPHGGDIYGRKILLDYSANTNPFGTPEGILQAISGELSNLHHYPDPYCRALVSAIAQREDLPENRILCGNGAAELIYAYCAALQPTVAAELAPTFSEYALGLSHLNCRVERFVLIPERDFVPDESMLPFLEETKPQVLFLCNPNNPTGKLLPQDLLERLLAYTRENKIHLFLDECFLDLTDDGVSLKNRLEENPHLLILRAFTKSYGMAGIRLGYCMSADSDLLARMSAITQPWNVSTLAQAAGVAALREEAFLERTRSVIRTERRWLWEQLRACGFSVVQGSANYILFRGPDDLHSRLLAQGIAIRNCDNYNGLGRGWYRIAVRLRPENEQLMAAIHRCRKEA